MRQKLVILTALALLTACAPTPKPTTTRVSLTTTTTLPTLVSAATTTSVPTIAPTATRVPLATATTSPTLVSIATTTLVPTVAPTATPKLTDTPVPTSTPTPLPWKEETLITSDNPLTFDNSKNPSYRHLPIFGSAMKMTDPVKVTVVMEVITGAESPRDSSNGLWMFNGLEENEKGSRVLFLGYQSGNWILISKKENAYEFSRSVLATRNKNAEFSLTIRDNGRTVIVVPPDKVERTFTLPESFGNALVMSAQTGPNSSLRISQLSMATLADTKTSTPTETLHSLAEKRGVTFGTLCALEDWKNPQYTAILRQEFDLCLEHDLWQPSIDQGGLAFADTKTNFALRNGMRIRAHPLIWGYKNPDYWEKGDLTSEQLESVMKNHITSLMTRYPMIAEWNVVNEAIYYNNGSIGFDNNVWYRTFGVEYIDMAFQFAREANPKAILIYNDYGIETPGPKADAVYNLISDLKTKGVPVDGIGMQFHMKATNPPKKDEMIANMKRFAALGIGVYITELDVNLFGLSGTKEEKEATQAQIYKDIVEACLQSGACKSITIWGISDKFSWLLQPEFQNLGGGDAPLIFDDDYSPKPAYYAIRDALAGK